MRRKKQPELIIEENGLALVAVPGKDVL